MQFDAVLAANVVERLAHPGLFLDQLAGLVKASGVVVLASAFSWSEHDTPKSNWLGGFYKVRCCASGLRCNMSYTRIQPLAFDCHCRRLINQ